MTVKDLIEKLKLFPPEVEVKIYDDDRDEYFPLEEVTFQSNIGYSKKEFVGLI
ncbi:MAG TPA: hypothetical protein VK568_05620 [Thermodesulfobacteriota bacterium]|jgi:hypothetical protein|nr:hypothetical protein [Thermodesulfobacteriota bacterium]